MTKKNLNLVKEKLLLHYLDFIHQDYFNNQFCETLSFQFFPSSIRGVFGFFQQKSLRNWMPDHVLPDPKRWEQKMSRGWVADKVEGNFYFITFNLFYLSPLCIIFLQKKKDWIKPSLKDSQNRPTLLRFALKGWPPVIVASL